MKTPRSLALGLALTLISAAPARGEQIGDWTLEIDAMTEMVDPLREEVEKTGAPLTIEASSFEVTYNGGALLSEQEKSDIVTRWSEAVLNSLNASGLRPMDRPGITQAQRQQLADMRKNMIDRLPFGMRAQMRNQIGDVAMLMDDAIAPCTHIDGAYAGTVMTIRPSPGVASDFGSIGVILIGMGSCGVAGDSAERRLSDTFDRAKRALMREMTARGAGR